MTGRPVVAGHPERTAIVGGGACARAVLAAVDSAAAVDLAAAVFGVKRREAERRCQVKFGGTYVAHRLEQSGSRTLAGVDNVVGGANSTDIL